jgi:hypothetical protein
LLPRAVRWNHVGIKICSGRCHQAVAAAGGEARAAKTGQREVPSSADEAAADGAGTSTDASVEAAPGRTHNMQQML